MLCNWIQTNDVAIAGVGMVSSQVIWWYRDEHMRVSLYGHQLVYASESCMLKPFGKIDKLEY